MRSPWQTHEFAGSVLESSSVCFVRGVRQWHKPRRTQRRLPSLYVRKVPTYRDLPQVEAVGCFSQLVRTQNEVAALAPTA